VETLPNLNHCFDKMTGRFAITLSLLIPSLWAWSQQRLIYQISQTPIPGINIRCITEDSHGFLWIGTQDGLFRYDSRMTRAFNKNATQKNNIGGPDIRDITESKDAIWATSTQGGVDKISELTGEPVLHLPQSRFPDLLTNTITSLVANDTLLFAGTEKGVYSYYNNKVSRIIADAYIDRLAKYNNYLLVFIRNVGIATYNITSGKVVCLLKTAKQHWFYSISCYTENSWLLGTSRGLNQVTVEENGQLSFIEKPFAYVDETVDNDVYAVGVDKNKNIWFSTENNLVKIEPATKQYGVVENAFESNTDFLNNIYKIYCDTQNNIWLCCQSGLFYLKNNPAPTRTFYRSRNSITRIQHAYYILPLNDSIAMITAANGLYKANINSRDISAVDVTQVYDYVFIDPNKKMLVSNKTGLKELRGTTLIPIDHVYPEFKPCAHYTINSAIQINSSEIVMGTENINGVLVWNFVKRTVDSINTRSRNIRLDNDIVNAVYKIRDDVFCVLTESSFYYIDWKKRTGRRFGFNKKGLKEEYALFFDMCKLKNLYYLSSYGNGVLVMDTSFNVKRILTVADGLSNNNVYKLLPWRDSLLYMTTNMGLNIYDPSGGNVKKMFSTDGLHSDIFEETSGYLYHDQIYAGGVNGFTVIYPEHITLNKTPPPCYISAVYIALPDSTHLDSFDISAKRVVIPSNATQTYIYFSGINHSSGERTTYAYKYKDAWIDIGTQNFIQFIGQGPGPGTYKLEVQAINEDGLPGNPAEIILEFRPKLYQTVMFKIWVLLVMAGIVYALYRYRLAQIRKQQKIRQQISADLHDDLGGTLNAISKFADMVRIDPKNPEYIEKIKIAIRAAITGLKDMIWILNDKLDTIADLATRFEQFARSIAPNIAITGTIEDGLSARILSKEEKKNLQLIFKETFTNALKYSGCTEFSYTIKSTGKKLYFLLHDDGKGFDMNNTVRGNGLDNVLFRANEMGYDSKIESAPGKGTTTHVIQK